MIDLTRMEYRLLGKTGLRVSRLGFGAMRFPTKDGRVDQESALKVIHRAFQLGVNYIDTAVGYCNSESELVVGKSLKGWPGKKGVVVSTKNPYKDSSGKEWRRNLDQSLQRLSVDAIDCYHLHDLRYEEFTGPMLGQAGPVFEVHRALKEGVIRHFGCSSHDTPENISRLLKTGEFEFLTVQYNLLNQVNEPVIRLAAELGLGVIIMGPVAGGQLESPSEKITDLLPGCQNTPEIALRFVLANPGVTVALSGMNTFRMVEENCRTAGRKEPLSPEERERVIAVLNQFQRLSELYCTGCGYCLPCPNGIDIPANFQLYNYFEIFGLKDLATSHYQGFGLRKDEKGKAAPAWAAACIECGQCEPKCPQKIPIRGRLKEVHKKLSRPDARVVGRQQKVGQEVTNH